MLFYFTDTHLRSLCVQDPVISEIFPTFGPKSGGTMLTIRGASLDTGIRREVTVGKAACKIQRSVYIMASFPFGGILQALIFLGESCSFDQKIL